MDRAFVQENDSSRVALRDLAAQMSDGDFNRVVGAWTISAWLCHLAFWDAVILSRLKMLQNKQALGQKLELSSVDSINDGCHLLSRAIPGRVAAKLALDSAGDVDTYVKQLSAETIAEIESAGLQRLLHRSLHRLHHVDAIRKALDTPEA